MASRTSAGIAPKTSGFISVARENKHVLLYGLAVSSSIVLYGYDLAIVGNLSAIPAFQREFGQRHNGQSIIPSLWLALWNTSSPIGSMAGAAIAGPLHGRLGRKVSLSLGSIISAVAVAGLFVSDIPDITTMMGTRRGIFLAAKLIQGVGVGIVICSTQTYLSEILPISIRAPVLAFIPIFTLVGQLVGAVVIFLTLKYPDNRAYKIPIATQWPFSAAPLVVSLFLPESPSWLVSRDNLDKAVHAQRKLQPREDPLAGVEVMRKDIEREREMDMGAGGRGYADCFRGANFQRTWIVILANLLPQVWGLALLSKASYFMQIVGMGADNSIIFLILGIGLGVIANVVSMRTVARFPRRLLILTSLGVSCALWAGMGIAGFWTNTVTIWYTGATLMAVVIVCGLGVWPAGYIVASETSSLELRGATQGIGWFAQALATAVMTFALPYIYNPDAGKLGGKTGFVYMGLCAVAFGLCWRLIPEMKDHSQAEIDDLFGAPREHKEL